MMTFPCKMEGNQTWSVKWHPCSITFYSLGECYHNMLQCHGMSLDILVLSFSNVKKAIVVIFLGASKYILITQDYLATCLLDSIFSVFNQSWKWVPEWLRMNLPGLRKPIYRHIFKDFHRFPMRENFRKWAHFPWTILSYITIH